MCFSATASFAVAVPLVPAGAYCLARARRDGPRWTLFAAYPLIFGFQQAVEGTVWLGVGAGDAALVGASSRLFLFFSHFFWLAWVPMSVLALESGRWRRAALVALALVGGVSGASIFLPLLLHGDWLTVDVVGHSLRYRISTVYDGIVSRNLLLLRYVAVIVASLLLCSTNRVRVFGILVLVSVVVAYAFYRYAFASVWCFFAAVVSLFVLYILRAELGPARPAAA